MHVQDEFVHRLKNGTEVIISVEAKAYRDEQGSLWIENMEVGLAIRDTELWEETVSCLEREKGAIKIRIEDRLEETFNEKSEAS